MIQSFNWVTGKARLKLNLYHVRVCDLNYTACVYVCVCARCLHQQHIVVPEGGQTCLSILRDLRSLAHCRKLTKFHNLPKKLANESKISTNEFFRNRNLKRNEQDLFIRVSNDVNGLLQKKVEWQLVIYDHIIRVFFTKSNIKFDSR